jgi:hypothetical protein
LLEAPGALAWPATLGRLYFGLCCQTFLLSRALSIFEGASKNCSVNIAVCTQQLNKEMASGPHVHGETNLEFFFFLLTLMVAENNVHIIPDF